MLIKLILITSLTNFLFRTIILAKLLGLTISVKCIWYFISFTDLVFSSLGMRQTKDIEPNIRCIKIHKSLCWLCCTVLGAFLHVWMVFLHEFMLCHLQMSVPHKAKRRATVWWFLFWPLKVSCHFSGWHLSVLHLLCLIFAAHCRVCFPYWGHISSIDADSFFKFICVCLNYMNCKYIQEYNHNCLQLQVLEFDWYYVSKGYRPVKLIKKAGALKWSRTKFL